MAMYEEVYGSEIPALNRVLLSLLMEHKAMMLLAHDGVFDGHPGIVELGLNGQQQLLHDLGLCNCGRVPLHPVFEPFRAELVEANVIPADATVFPPTVISTANPFTESEVEGLFKAILGADPDDFGDDESQE